MIGDRLIGKLKLDMKTLVWIGFIVGALAGAMGLLDHFVDWLLFLLVMVPPVPGVIWADYYVCKHSKFIVDKEWNWAAPIAWLVGGLTAHFMPVLGTTALTGLIVAFVVYIAIMKAEELLVESRKPAAV
jgi:cytosine permease